MKIIASTDTSASNYLQQC